MGEWNGLKFAAGDVRGTRAFKVDQQGRLRGVVFEKIWRPGENVAVCLRGVSPEDVKPGAKPHNPAARTSGGVVAAGGSGGNVFVNGTLIGSGGSFSSSSFGNLLAAGGMPGMARCTCGCNQMRPTSPPGFGGPVQCLDGPAGKDCQCGFYAYQEGSNDFYDPGQRDHGAIGGVVRGYGKVVLCERGFRAEKAEIVALYVDRPALRIGNPVTHSLIRRRVERNYDVPVFDDYLEMLNEFPPDDPEPQDDFWEAS